ncbi:MAG: hypothetical protein HN658_05080 [Rhodospirillales bacterium]|jgi:short subunit dehydrogenase-like uncharacterized protein|nr:hypothetical protein [Rhodospirillales bacterium]MBT4006781.1 hypothetical protein [Rhodospirillales bacterium]MBT5077273.1 hypothetical protein [Rhodospirillales bacterium]MBT5113692.1 hypothetical protein [Rhodospirillales bacterium]MBT5673995.1 hypothetical protein [Rhodospirillales bacterium]
MSDLIAAQEQMEKAIARLEAAVGSQSENNETNSTDSAVDNALLGARADYENLRKVTDSVSERLDAVIDWLRSTLEEKA